MYKILVRFLLIVRRRLSFIIVGANDGKVNDPSYDLIMRYKGRTDVLLIEPNTALIPFLKENYSLHPSHSIANCAIGKGDVLQLFVIKESWWERFRPSYAKGWPEYRAATGVTSETKSHVEEALLKVGLEPKEAIDVVNVPVRSLAQLCEECSWANPIDILQIDVEGHDDTVIVSTNFERLRPKMILFESNKLEESRKAALDVFLKREKYRVFKIGYDSLAIDSRITPVCICLRLFSTVIYLAMRLKLL